MEQPGTFRLPVTRGQTFSGTKVTLDNVRFENCVFKNCDVLYATVPSACAPVLWSICLSSPHDCAISGILKEVPPGISCDLSRLAGSTTAGVYLGKKFPDPIPATLLVAIGTGLKSGDFSVCA